jgi:hypothetical protein
MKLSHAAVFLAAAFLAGCGGGLPEGDVRFIGFAPVTSKDKDVRAVQTYCPMCHEVMEIDKADEKNVKNRCENKKCRTKVEWREKYNCPSCQGSGRCAACTAMEQWKGECYNCRGQGVLIYAGQSPNCPNCKGTKQCPICKGTQKCDYCEGTGKVAKEIVKARAAKSSGNELPESDAPKATPKPDEKKDEQPKETKKEETKKEEGGSSDDKKEEKK